MKALRQKHQTAKVYRCMKTWVQIQGCSNKVHLKRVKSLNNIQYTIYDLKKYFGPV